MENTEDRNDGVICIQFPPRKTAFANEAINAHKDIWEVENMKKLILTQQMFLVRDQIYLY